MHCALAAVEWRSSSCRYYGDLKVDGGGSGYLSNLVTEELGLGSVRCPWVVRASRGQRINLTLFDFGVAYRFDDVGNMCHVYAKISETPMTWKTTSDMTSDMMTSETTSEMTVCGSGTRERSVFISDTNRLEVSIMNLKLDDESVYFLLKYEGMLVTCLSILLSVCPSVCLYVHLSACLSISVAAAVVFCRL